MNIAFSDKNVLIIGGSGDIGSKIVESFVKSGAATIIASTTNKNKAANKFATFNKNNIKILELNLEDRSSVYDFMGEVKSVTNKIDILVNAAGWNEDRLTPAINDEDWDKSIQINLSSVFIINREVAKMMSKNQYGKIINLSSVVAITGNKGQVAYGSAKAGLIAMTKSMAMEFGKRNITCNVVAPGYIETNMTQSLPEQIKQEILTRTPLQRYGSAQDIANVTLFLASEYASYITGSVINVNGGLYTGQQ